MTNNNNIPKNILPYIGTTRNELTCISYAGFFAKPGCKKPEHYINVKCSCGTEKIISFHKFGITKHCGNVNNHDPNVIEKQKIIKNLVGKTFGDLSVIEYLGHYATDTVKEKYHWYKCRCVCGKEVIYNHKTLLRGLATTCKSGSPLHTAGGRIGSNITNNMLNNRYRSMHHRCYLNTKDSYHLYGGRGIYVCDEWIMTKYWPEEKRNQYTDLELRTLSAEHYNNYEKWFFEELKRLGLTFEQSKELNYTVDRINNDGPYAPWNCRLVTQAEQMLNVSYNIRMEVKGVPITTQKLFNILYDKNKTSMNEQQYHKALYGYLDRSKKDIPTFIEKYDHEKKVENYINLAAKVFGNLLKIGYDFAVFNDQYNYDYIKSPYFNNKKITLNERNNKSNIITSKDGTEYIKIKN